jgi:hypothetical protein
MLGFTLQEKAYLAPFAGFLALMLLGELVSKLFDGVAGPWWLAEPQYWVLPLQAVVCGILLARGWRHYELRPIRGVAVACLVGIAVLLIWIAPQLWFGVPPRLVGFDPTFFPENSWAYQLTLAFRFVRLVIVVPLLEEIFWRGFLLRHLIREPFTEVPFGSFSWLSFSVVTLGFCLEHQPADWVAAALAGTLYNLVAYRTRSLSACVIAHAVTNLLLGIYVMRTGQWGFW